MDVSFSLTSPTMFEYPGKVSPNWSLKCSIKAIIVPCFIYFKISPIAFIFTFGQIIHGTLNIRYFYDRNEDASGRK